MSARRQPAVGTAGRDGVAPSATDAPQAQPAAGGPGTGTDAAGGGGQRPGQETDGVLAGVRAGGQPAGHPPPAVSRQDRVAARLRSAAAGARSRPAGAPQSPSGQPAAQETVPRRLPARVPLSQRARARVAPGQRPAAQPPAAPSAAQTATKPAADQPPAAPAADQTATEPAADQPPAAAAAAGPSADTAPSAAAPIAATTAPPAPPAAHPADAPAAVTPPAATTAVPAPDGPPAAGATPADGSAPADRAAPPADPVTGLSARLMALARMIQIGSARSGRDGFGASHLAEAEEVLARAGERMRLSSSHTVVVLAGGTGSGKSSLFNKLAGADLSTVGVTRPVTKDAHACVWGEAGSGPILDWLDVPARYRYARASALDSGEQDLAGLVLLDLPDHDSVMNHSGELVDRLVAMADVMVWVLDPQKYADAAVHRRFLVPMAGHSDVLAVVLNQTDLLDSAQADDCVADLRRLLDAENLHDVPILMTSAATGAGLDELRGLLGRGVAARRAAVARISADVDDVVGGLGPYAGDGRPAAREVPAHSKVKLADRLAAAAGVAGISEALRSARELRAVDFIGWPVAWFVQRLSGRDPVRKVRLGMLWNDLRSVTAGPAGAQQAEVDNALTDLGNELATGLPAPWSHTVRAAVRSRADEIPAAVGSAIGEALPAEDSVVWWWRLAGVWQGLLLGAAAVAVGWFALVLAFGVFHAAAGMPALLSDTRVLTWIAAGAAVVLALGAATSTACLRLVRKSAEREDAAVVADMRERIAAVARDMVVLPGEQELAELARYREEAAIAAGDPAAGL